MKQSYAARLLLIATLVALAACGGAGEGDEALPTALPNPIAERPSSSAKLTLVEPASHSVLSPDDVPVRLELTGARFTKKASRNLRPDESHIHLRLDGEKITLLGDPS